jgi:hypothetical protein
MTARTIAWLCGVTMLAAAPAHGQQLDDLIARNIKARGGLERLKAVNTMRSTGKVVQDGLDIIVVQENKRPAKVRSEFTIQGMTGIQAYDGTTGWQVIPFGGRRDPETLSGDDMKSLVESADIDGPLVDWQAKGHKVEYLGLDPVDGTDAHKIRIVRANGDVQTVYLDVDALLEIRIENKRTIRGEEVETQTDLGNYEEVEGLMIPFSFESGPKASTNRQKLKITKVEINIPLADDRFAMPKTAGSAPTTQR